MKSLNDVIRALWPTLGHFFVRRVSLPACGLMLPLRLPISIISHVMKKDLLPGSYISINISKDKGFLADVGFGSCLPPPFRRIPKPTPADHSEYSSAIACTPEEDGTENISLLILTTSLMLTLTWVPRDLI
jgi:hypothetical protein